MRKTEDHASRQGNRLIKKAYVTCTGCPESRVDTARVQSFVKENGWAITDDPKQADLVLFRACGLTEKTTEQSLTAIRILGAQRKRGAPAHSMGLSAKDRSGSSWNGICRGDIWGEGYWQTERGVSS